MAVRQLVDRKPIHQCYNSTSSGQSNQSGEGGINIISTTQTRGNLKLYDSAWGNGANMPTTPGGNPSGTYSLVPLIAPLRPLSQYGNYIYEWPDNITFETNDTGFANQMTDIAGWKTVVTNVAETAHPMNYIKKGGSLTPSPSGGYGRAYASLLLEVAKIKELAAAQGWNSIIVPCHLFTHGEGDSARTQYKGELIQYWTDLNTDIKAITGQREDIPIILSQQCSAPATTTGRSESTIALQELAAEYPEKFYVMPRYQYFCNDQDGALHYRYHIDSVAARRLGEQKAHVYDRGSRGLKTTLKPLSATLTGNVVRIEFEVPFGSLQFSETQPAVHPIETAWSNGKGFEVEDNGGRITINSVRILGNAVEITCNTTPGTGKRVSYAMYQDAVNYNCSIDVGRHGLLCDSDPFVGYSAKTIACNVTNGSADITCVTTGEFNDRGQFELVSGSGLIGGSHVTLKPNGDNITLGQVWTGSTGTANLYFKNDHRNYCIQFTLTL